MASDAVWCICRGNLPSSYARKQPLTLTKVTPDTNITKVKPLTLFTTPRTAAAAAAAAAADADVADDDLADADDADEGLPNGHVASLEFGVAAGAPAGPAADLEMQPLTATTPTAAAAAAGRTTRSGGRAITDSQMLDNLLQTAQGLPGGQARGTRPSLSGSHLAADSPPGSLKAGPSPEQAAQGANSLHNGPTAAADGAADAGGDAADGVKRGARGKGGKQTAPAAAVAVARGKKQKQGAGSKDQQQQQGNQDPDAESSPAAEAKSRRRNKATPTTSAADTTTTTTTTTTNNRQKGRTKSADGQARAPAAAAAAARLGARGAAAGPAASAAGGGGGKPPVGKGRKAPITVGTSNAYPAWRFVVNVIHTRHMHPTLLFASSAAASFVATATCQNVGLATDVVLNRQSMLAKVVCPCSRTHPGSAIVFCFRQAPLGGQPQQLSRKPQQQVSRESQDPIQDPDLPSLPPPGHTAAAAAAAAGMPAWLGAGATPTAAGRSRPATSAPEKVTTPYTSRAQRAAASAAAEAASEGEGVISAASPGSGGRKRASRLAKLGGTPQAKRLSAAERARKAAAAAAEAQAAAAAAAGGADDDDFYAFPEEEAAKAQHQKGKEAAADSAGEQQRSLVLM